MYPFIVHRLSGEQPILPKYTHTYRNERPHELLFFFTTEVYLFSYFIVLLKQKQQFFMSEF